MIRPLRRRHRWMVAGVAVIVAPLCLAALAARPERTVQAELPPALGAPVVTPAGAGVELPSSPPLRVRPTPDGRIELTAEGPIDGAGLLLYWLPTGARGPADGHLLGAVAGGARQLLVPPAAATAPGELLLYSLGHGEEVARAAWPGVEP